MRLGTGGGGQVLGCKDVHPAPAAEAERSRRASRAPPGALGGMSYRRCQPPRHVEAPEAVERLPRRRGRKPERSVHRGSCGAGLETPRAGRRRVGGLAATTTERRFFREASLRLRLARGAGPRVRRGPGVPRALPVFRRARWQNSGAQRAARMRAAVRRSNRDDAARNASATMRDRCVTSSPPAPSAGRVCPNVPRPPAPKNLRASG